jgi:hypothetical protein
LSAAGWRDCGCGDVVELHPADTNVSAATTKAHRMVCLFNVG